MMKAAVLTAPGKLVLTSLPVPSCGEDGVLVKVKTACICNGSDPSILSGRTWTEFPAVFGHEAFGEIVEVGSKVKGYSEGDQISWWFTLGAFAQYVMIRPEETAVLKLPADMPREEAPIFELVIAASRAVYAADVAGKRVIIQGMGPSGLIMAQLCRSMGSMETAGIDLYESRRRLGRYYGCSELDDAGGYDILIDAFGNEVYGQGADSNRMIGMLRDGGELILYGQPPEGRRLDSHLIQKKQIQIRLPSNDICRIRDMAKDCLEFYLAGELSLKELVTDIISFEEIPAALEELCRQPQKHIKMIVDMERAGM